MSYSGPEGGSSPADLDVLPRSDQDGQAGPGPDAQAGPDQGGEGETGPDGPEGQGPDQDGQGQGPDGQSPGQGPDAQAGPDQGEESDTDPETGPGQAAKPPEEADVVRGEIARQAKFGLETGQTTKALKIISQLSTSENRPANRATAIERKRVEGMLKPNGGLEEIAKKDERLALELREVLLKRSKELNPDPDNIETIDTELQKLQQARESHNYEGGNALEASLLQGLHPEVAEKKRAGGVLNTVEQEQFTALEKDPIGYLMGSVKEMENPKAAARKLAENLSGGEQSTEAAKAIAKQLTEMYYIMKPDERQLGKVEETVENVTGGAVFVLFLLFQVFSETSKQNKK